MPIKKRLQSLHSSLVSPNARFWALAVFLVIVFLTGGGSRDDIQSLIVLRPLAALFAAYALATASYSEWKGRLASLYLMVALACLMIVQLIPLPPSIWTTFPGRQVFADIAVIIGMEQPWRPISLSPSKTLNGLYSLLVPMATVFLYLNLEKEHRNRILNILTILMAASAALAILQILGPPRSPLYLYQITNNGSAVGFFANRNHQAVMLIILIVMLGWSAGFSSSDSYKSKIKLAISLGSIFILVPLILLTGSRFGLILMFPSLVMALGLIYFAKYGRSKALTSGRALGKLSLKSPTVLIVIIGGALLLLTVLAIMLSRSLAFDRLFADNNIEELRVQLFPFLLSMANDYMPWGIGIGAFENVYKINEPQELLRSQYLNQAHSDWLQFVIEGGLMAIIIIAVFLVWLCKCIFSIVTIRKAAGHHKYLAVMIIFILAVIGAASVADYPLRVPITMSIASLLLAQFQDSVRHIQSGFTATRR